MSSAVATPVIAPELYDEQPLRRRRRPDYVGIGLWIALAITALLWFLPLFLMFMTSVKSKPDLNSTPMWSLPNI